MSADLLEVFDRLAPPDGWDEPTDLDTDPTAAAILTRVLADDGSTVVSLAAARRRRRRAAAGITVVTALVAGAAAAILTRQPETTERLACWTEAAPEPAEVLELEWDGVADPVARCEAQWAAGALGAPVPNEFEACVGDGAVAVIPGPSGTCAAVGLTPYVADPTASSDEAVERATQLLAERFGTSCVPADEAEIAVRDVLAENGLDHWTITIADATSVDETCATVRLDATTSVADVILVPPD